MSLTLVDLAAQLQGWRGPYLRYAFAVTDVAPLPADYRSHLDRVIARRSGLSSTGGLPPTDPRREARSRAVAAYAAVTKRRRDALANYFLVRAVHDALWAPGVVVTARITSGAIETLRPVDLSAASIDIGANSLVIGSVSFTQVQVETPALRGAQPSRESKAGPASPVPANPRSGETPGIIASDQARFDDELRRRVATRQSGPEGYRDPMIGWAQHELGVDPTTAEGLWESRSAEFSRRAGRRKSRTAS